MDADVPLGSPGLSRTFISDVKTGMKEPCLRSLETSADGFQVTLSELFKGLDRK